MFRNRHINFGFFSVILVVFVIAISASCKLAYAQPAPKPKMVITIDADTGVIDNVVVRSTGGPITPVSKQTGHPPVVVTKKAIPAMILTHKRNPTCISFVIAGTHYTYCW